MLQEVLKNLLKLLVLLLDFVQLIYLREWLIEPG